MRQRCIGLSLVMILITVLAVNVGAAKWQPFQLEGDEYYEFKASWDDGDGLQESIFILDIRKTGKMDPNGNEIVDLSLTSKNQVVLEDLLSQGGMGLLGSSGISMAMLLSPIYSFFFTDLDLAVGEKMSLYGAGMISVIDTLTIAGREGYLCQFTQKEDGEEMLTAEWVIDPELGIPLLSRTYEYGKLVSEVLVLNYKHY